MIFGDAWTAPIVGTGRLVRHERTRQRERSRTIAFAKRRRQPPAPKSSEGRAQTVRGTALLAATCIAAAAHARWLPQPIGNRVTQR